MFWPTMIGSTLLFLVWCSAHGPPSCPAIFESREGARVSPHGAFPPVPHGVGAYALERNDV